MRALAVLKPGGRLVYSTCSLELEENEEVVAEAIAQLVPKEIRRISPGEAISALKPHLAEGVDAAQLFDEDGQFRTFPGEHGTDGFFAAILEKPSLD